MTKALTFLLFLWTILSCPVNGEWATITSPGFILTYDPVDESVAEEVLEFADEGLERVSKSLRFRPEEKTTIYLCSTQKQFRELTRGGVPDWGIGCAIPKSGTIVLKSPRAARRNLDLKTIISHEISHVLLGKALRGIRPPRWFDEGLAIYQSKEWRLGDGLTLAWASLFNSIIPLSQLEDSFPTEERRANLAYTEGFSAVSFIVTDYGEESLMELISSLAKSGDMDGAFGESLGLGYPEFQSLWLQWVKRTYSLPYLFSTTPLFWGGVAVLLLLIFLVKRSMTRRRLAKLGES